MMKLNELIERDIKKSQIKYQIQAQKDRSIVKLAYVKEKNDFCVYQEEIEDFTCFLLSYTLSDKDIINESYPVLGYLIKNSVKHPVATLDFIFYRNGEIAKEMQGRFEIVFTNDKNEKRVLKKIDVYPGDEQVICALSELLYDVFEIIEKNENTT